MKKKIIDETIGWCGMGLIVVAYALISFDYMSSSSIIYQILNCVGALGIVYISLKKKAYQPGVLNIIWAVIAVIAIIRLLF